MKNFTYKSAEEVMSMTPQEQDLYMEEKRTHEEELQKTMVNEAVKPINTSIKRIEENINSIEEQLKKVYNINVEDEIKSAILEKMDIIKEIYTKGSGMVEVEIGKSAGSITTTSGTIPTLPATVGVDMVGGLPHVNLRSISVEAFTTTLSTDSSTYAYVEVKPKEGDFEVVTEGGVKPQTDLTWETQYAQPKKIAAYVRVTEEAIQDVKGLESTIRDLLKKKHDLKKAKLILKGDGAGINPKGAFSYGKTFTAGTMAASIENPNLLDVINACITRIATTHNYEDETAFRPNLVLLNPTDFYIHFASAKDKNGNYLFPNASLFGNVVIGGVTIVNEEAVPVGKIFVGDMSQYNITNYMPYVVKIGWVNDDFIKNQFVILAESRFHAFVRKAGELAFIYDDIATIKTAITKP